METGPSFHLGSKEEENDDHDNPDSFPWCLMNLCVTKMVQDAVRKVLSTAGLEVLGEIELLAGKAQRVDLGDGGCS